MSWGTIKVSTGDGFMVELKVLVQIQVWTLAQSIAIFYTSFRALVVLKLRSLSLH